MPNKPIKPKIGMWIDTPDYLCKRIKLSAVYDSIEKANKDGYTEKILYKDNFVILATQITSEWASFAAAIIPQITNSKQRKTLKKIFTLPTPNDILWTDIESLLKHIGCVIEYNKGSRMTFKKDKEMIFIHRPHPQKQTPPETIKEIKNFLEDTGVTP